MIKQVRSLCPRAPSLALPLAALVCALAPAALAQSLNQRGIARLNQDVQTLWAQDGIPLARSAATSELQKLVGVPHAITSNLNATITGINSLGIDAPGAPGVRTLNGSGVDVALPLSGRWNISAGVEVQVKGKLLFVNINQTFAVTIALKNVYAELQATFDSSDLSAPRVTSVRPPIVHFDLSVTSTNVIVGVLGWISGGLVDTVGQAVVGAAAVYIASKLDILAGTTPSVLNAGGPALAPIARGDLEGAAAKLGDQNEQYRKPYGPILEVQFDAPYNGTWADSLKDPHFTPGNVIAPFSYGDSGEMTGHDLAALAFEYATTHSQIAKARAQKDLATLRTLLTMRGEPGNMNRSIMPISFLPGWMRPSTTYVSGKDYAAMWNGQLYDFSDGMSRDEYMGLFYGLSWAHDLFDDPAMQADAQAQIEMALDYLLRNNWTWRRRDGTFGERWAGVLEEQYAWVLVGWHGNPAKYQSVKDQYQGFDDLLWTGYWAAVMDPYFSYYKFQLGIGAIHVLLDHETDPAGFMRAYQSVAIMRHFLGHHLNAHFNSTYLAFDPASKARLGTENTNLLSRWLLWPRRQQRIDLHGDASIAKVNYTAPLDPSALWPSLHPATVQIAAYPLPPDQRIASGFMWSVSPCQLDPGYPAGPNPYVEGETLDFVLPYWMSRYYGAITPPRVTPVPVPVGSNPIARPGIRETTSVQTAATGETL